MWTGWVYGAAILVSSLGMTMIDRRWRLVFFRDPASSVVVLAGSVCVFLLWDLVGITAGVFFRGSGPWMTGVQIAPEIPVEELLFLAFLTQLSLVLHAATSRLFDGGVRAERLMLLGSWAGIALFLLIVVASTLWMSCQGTTYQGTSGIRADAQSLTYALVIVPITLLAVVLGVLLSRGRERVLLPTLATLAVICLLTAVFDSFIVAAGIVDYDRSLTSGIMMGAAPAEDCGYAVSAAVLAPAVWTYLRHRRRVEQ